MPELPDVEVFRKYLQSTSMNQKIGDVKIFSTDMVKGVSAQKLTRLLQGASFVWTERHGKYLMAGVGDDSFLVLHFGMTGFLKYFGNTEEGTPHMRMRIDFENGYHLSFDCMRKLGEISWSEDREGFAKERKLGADPLHKGFNASRFAELIRKKRGSIKSALMNQEVVAGIGNIYSDEILFQARVHPGAGIKDLEDKDLQELYKAMKDVLKTAIKSKADPRKLPGSFLIGRRQEGAECPRCGARIQKRKFSGRGAYMCPVCQKER